MLKLRGIAVTDQVNRYNEQLAIEGIVKAYSEAWNTGFPASVNHDHTKCIGWSYLYGIFLEPGMAYQTNGMLVAETKDEHEELNNKLNEYQYKNNYLDKKYLYDELYSKIKIQLSPEHKMFWANAVTILDDNIISRLFPELIDKMKDGLLPIKYLDPVLPGVYKKGEFLLFAHNFFRRNVSRKNTLNTALLERLEKLRNTELDVKIAIDMDMVGLFGTQSVTREYQYWWGPSFNDDLTQIPVGVTRYENENYNELMSNIRQTEFSWYIQDERKTLECEEITDIPNITRSGEEYYGCRFVHSMIDSETGLPYHLDGAIRAYSDEKLLTRFDLSLVQTERDTWYTKLWRIDNPLSVGLWKELITHYYRDNRLVGEYFGGVDEQDQKEIAVSEKVESVFTPLNEYVPTNINASEGIRTSIQFHKKFTMNSDLDVVLKSSDYIIEKNRQEKFYEAETLSFIKLLKRVGIRIRIPFIKRVGYEDTVFNFPIFLCRTQEVAKIVQESILQLCQAWSLIGGDRLLSYSIQLNYEQKSVLFSFAGDIDSIEKALSRIGTNLPEENQLPKWIKSMSDFLNTYERVNGHPRILDLMRENGTLHFKRKMVPPQLIEKTESDSKGVYAILKVKPEEYDNIKENNIQVAPMYIIKNSLCNHCKKPYIQCDCIKFIDDNISETIEDIEWLGMAWTIRHA